MHLLQNYKYAFSCHCTERRSIPKYEIQEFTFIYSVLSLCFSVGSHTLKIVNPFNSKPDYTNGLDKYCDIENTAVSCTLGMLDFCTRSKIISLKYSYFRSPPKILMYVWKRNICQCLNDVTQILKLIYR